LSFIQNKGSSGERRGELINKQEMLKYLLVGGVTTFVNWSVYALTVEIARQSIIFGNTVSWAVAASFAFIVNKIWVFNSRSWKKTVLVIEAGSFFGTRFVSSIIEIAGVPLLISLGLDYPLFGVKGFTAKVSVGIIVTILNYIFSKFFVFRPRKGQ